MARTAHRTSVLKKKSASAFVPSSKGSPRTFKPSAHDFLEYYFLYRIAATLTDKMAAPSPLREVKNIINDFFYPAEYALLLWEEEPPKFRLKSYAGEARPRLAARLAGEENFLRTAMTQKTPTYVPDLSRAALPPLRDWSGPEMHGALVVAPLYVRAQHCSGVLLLRRKRPEAFSPRELALLHKIAMQLGKVLDKIALHQQTRALSITDALTGLYNRRHFNERYAAEMLRAVRYQRPLSVLLVDIDHFKKFNDEHGHLVGDKVLKLTAKVLNENVRKVDLLARFGGEEFVVVLPEIDKEHARQVAEKLRRAMELTHFPKEESQPTGHITASFGLASFPEDAAEGEILLQRADEALYEAKAKGRNRVEAAKIKD